MLTVDWMVKEVHVVSGDRGWWCVCRGKMVRQSWAEQAKGGRSKVYDKGMLWWLGNEIKLTRIRMFMHLLGKIR